jgi:hypothetical protein
MCDPSFTVFCVGMLLALYGGVLLIVAPAIRKAQSRRVRVGHMKSLVIHGTFVDVGLALAFIGAVGFVVQFFS